MDLSDESFKKHNYINSNSFFVKYFLTQSRSTMKVNPFAQRNFLFCYTSYFFGLFYLWLFLICVAFEYRHYYLQNCKKMTAKVCFTADIQRNMLDDGTCHVVVSLLANPFFLISLTLSAPFQRQIWKRTLLLK